MERIKNKKIQMNTLININYKLVNNINYFQSQFFYYKLINNLQLI